MDPKGLFDYARETDTILIFNGNENSVDKTFFYLTEVRSGIFEGSTLIVKPDGLKILTSKLEEQSARESGHEVIVVNSSSDFEEKLKQELKETDVIGLNYSSLTLENYTRILRIIPEKRFVDVSASIEECRRIKHPSEIKKLKEAARIASEAFPIFIEKLKEGITERELAAEVEYEMMKLGASGASFSTIVAFGKNASMPHYSPGNTKLKKGDFVLVDYGALYERYCSDTTRTVIFGRGSAKQKEMYEIVKNAQEESIKAIRENVNGKDVDAVARKIIDSSPYRGKFIHGLGHGLGMDVHDHPALGTSLDIPLKENMVITDEPGVYDPEIGGVRIEDDLIVKKNGSERITTSTREYMEIS